MNIQNRKKLLTSLIQNKCPQCRTGNLYKNSFYHIAHLMSMPEKCGVCNLQFEQEVGFWWGTGYLNYFLSVFLGFIIAGIWALSYGFSVYDNSVYYFLIVVIVSLLLLQPFIMRYGRTLFLYFHVKYNPKETEKG